MGDLTKNLSRHEFACPCGCEFDTVDFVLVTWLQACVDYFERMTGRDLRIEISSGNRCESHNDMTPGASDTSLHVDAKAGDIKLFFRDFDDQLDPELVAEYFEEFHPDCGLGRYPNRTHVDCRGFAARWDAR